VFQAQQCCVLFIDVDVDMHNATDNTTRKWEQLWLRTLSPLAQSGGLAHDHTTRTGRTTCSTKDNSNPSCSRRKTRVRALQLRQVPPSFEFPGLSAQLINRISLHWVAPMNVHPTLSSSRIQVGVSHHSHVAVFAPVRAPLVSNLPIRQPA
jgi:hypothetical protein